MKSSALLVAFALLAPGLALGQDGGDEVIVAFGDSITLGDPPFDEERKGGYPARLQRILRGEDLDVTVLNQGRSGELTAQGLSRIDAITAESGADIVLIMEGTNDIDLVQQGFLSIESIVSNLSEMTRRVEARNAEPILSTLMPRGPRANRDRESVLTRALNVQIRGLAFRRESREVESFEVFREAPQPYGTIFYLGPDPVGHPNAAGFELMAQTFADVIQDVDSMHPVVGEHQPLSVVQPTVQPGQVFEVFVHDFGEGLDKDSMTLTLNGLPVDTDIAGNDRRRLLSHEATNETIRCFARLGVNAADLADPPNRLEVVIAEYERANATVRRTDLTRDCRVDGRDILELAEVFGARQNEFRFDPLLDLNGDKVIDGDDLARIAADFGKTTS